MRTTLMLLVLTAALSACATPGSRYSPRDSARITLAEIEETHASTAYDLVQRLRPAWLRTRGSGSILLPSPIRVYVDGAPYGQLSALSQIPASYVRLIERLRASEATRRFGTDHANGAILVTTR